MTTSWTADRLGTDTSWDERTGFSGGIDLARGDTSEDTMARGDTSTDIVAVSSDSNTGRTARTPI